MRLFAHILNANGHTAGEGPVFNIRSAIVTRVLDGAGSVSIDVPGTDRRAIELLKNKRRMVIYVQDPATNSTVLRELGRGIIDVIDRGDAASAWTMSASGPDILGEMKYTNTLFARSYRQKTISEMVSALVSLTDEWGWLGWSATASGTSNLISARYDAVTALKALQSLVSQQGLHLRLGRSGKLVEVSAFGQIAEVTLVNPKQVSPEIYDNPDIALIERIRTSTASEDLITWLLPLAGGQNVDSALTLEYSNRTSPYAIQTMTGPDGRTLRYIKKQSAVDEYGIIPKIGTFKEISALSNTDADLRDASNMTYDAAVATLDRYTMPQESYSLTVKKCAETLLPGDKIHIQYIGEVEVEDGDGQVTFKHREIDGDFWIMKATERVTADGVTLDLDVSVIDRYNQDIAQVIMSGLDQITIQGINVQPGFNRSNMGPYSYSLDSTHPIIIPLKITNATFELNRCLLTVSSRPFRSNVAAAAIHDHLMMRTNDSTPVGAMATQRFTIIEQGTGTPFHFDALSDVGAGFRFIQSASNNSGALVYGIYDDTTYPDQVSVTVDGILVASNLGTTVSGFTVELDITKQLVNAAGGLRQQHTILIECTGGQGEVEVQVELYDKITPFKFG